MDDKCLTTCLKPVHSRTRYDECCLQLGMTAAMIIDVSPLLTSVLALSSETPLC